MKKSTRILVAMAIITISLVVAVPITMTYKLNHSIFTRINPLRDFPVDLKYFENVRVVRISGVHCDLIVADSFKLQLDKRIAPHSKTEQRGDTLFVSATVAGGRIRVLSKDIKVIAMNSEITIRGSYNPYDLASYYIELDNSKLYTQPIGSDPRMWQHIGNVSVTGANNSSVAMAGPVKMGELHMQNISSIELDKMIGASDLRVEYSEPVIVKSHSHDGKMSVEIE